MPQAMLKCPKCGFKTELGKIKLGNPKHYRTITTFPSKSKPGKRYTVKQDETGTLSCSCPVWIFKQWGRRDCPHVRIVRTEMKELLNPTLAIPIKLGNKKLKHIYKAEDELVKAGVHFDTGTRLVSPQERHWELDWSLRGAKMKNPKNAKGLPLMIALPFIPPNPLVSKHMEDVTPKQVERLVDLVWKAFERYESYKGDPRDEKGTKLYRDYQRRREEVEGYRSLYPDIIPLLPNPRRVFKPRVQKLLSQVGKTAYDIPQPCPICKKSVLVSEWYEHLVKGHGLTHIEAIHYLQHPGLNPRRKRNFLPLLLFSNVMPETGVSRGWKSLKGHADKPKATHVAESLEKKYPGVETRITPLYPESPFWQIFWRPKFQMVGNPRKSIPRYCLYCGMEKEECAKVRKQIHERCCPKCTHWSDKESEMWRNIYKMVGSNPKGRKVKVCWHCKRPVRETVGKSGLCRKCIGLAKLKNPADLYAAFHGVSPKGVRKVNFRNPKLGERVIKIGRLKELVYHPEPPSLRSKSEFIHSFGDFGDKFMNVQPVLAVSKDGKQLYIINDRASPKFGGRGIVG